MKRALIFAHTASMIFQFNMENIKTLQAMGYEVDVACNPEEGNSMPPQKIQEMKQQLVQMGVTFHQLPVPRKVTAIGRIIKSVGLARKLMNERQYDLIHCHSPVGSVVCRTANRLSKGYGKTRMLYTAHGFHFYKGAPIANWLILYPVEWVCSHWTDTLITINREDYALACRKMKAKQVEYVPGVGIDIDAFAAAPVDRAEIRRQLDVPEDGIVLLSVGELNENKNHETVIRALGQLNRKDVYYAVAGQGAKKEALEQLAESLGIGERVQLLGFRRDIRQLCKSVDVFVFPSYREGLSVALMEAMAASKPVVCSRIRGNTDLIDEGGGILFDPHSIESCRAALEQILQADRTALGQYNGEKVKNFSLPAVQAKMREIYSFEK